MAELKGGFQDENRQRGGGGGGGDRFRRRDDPADDERRLRRMKERAEAMRNVKSIWAPSVSPPKKVKESIKQDKETELKERLLEKKRLKKKKKIRTITKNRVERMSVREDAFERGGGEES